MKTLKEEINAPLLHPEGLTLAFRHRMMREFAEMELNNCALTDAQKQSFWRVVKFQGEDNGYAHS